MGTSVASRETSFSKLKLKTYLKSSVGQDRISNLALHSHVNVNVKNCDTKGAAAVDSSGSWHV